MHCTTRLGIAVAVVAAVTLLTGYSSAHAGTITIVDGPNSDDGDAVVNDAYIEGQLASGDFTVDTDVLGSGPDDIRVSEDVTITWTSDFSLTLRAGNDIIITGTIQHDGPSSGDGGVGLIADTDANGSGSVYVGTGEQTSGVAVGSSQGSTRVDAVDLVLRGGGALADAPPPNLERPRYAMVGYHAAGRDDTFITNGAISVTLSRHLTATGGIGHAYVQIGHGGYRYGDFGSATNHDLNGPITIQASGNVVFLGGVLESSYAQLGNGGMETDGNHIGNHSLDVAGDVIFQGGDRYVPLPFIITHGYAQYGNGGLRAEGNHNGSHYLEAGGSTTFSGGGLYAYAQLGNGGRAANGDHSGGHDLQTAGDVRFQASVVGAGYAQFGNGGAFAFGNHTGSHLLNAGGSVDFMSSSSYAQFGNGDLASSGTGNLGGNLTLSAAYLTVSPGPNAIIGHGTNPTLGPDEGDRIGDIIISVGTTAVITRGSIGHVPGTGPDPLVLGTTVIGVSQNNPYTGTGQLIASDAVFASAPAADGGELRFYLPSRASQQISTDTNLNRQSFPKANTIPEDRIQGFHLFGDGPYSAPYSFYLGGLPDVAIAKDVAPEAPSAPGLPITYTLAFSNVGANPAMNVVMTDSLPIQLSSATVTLDPDAGVAITQTSDAPNLAWQVSDLDVGQGGTITVTTTVADDSALLGTTITNTVSITATGDDTPSNNSASVGIEIVANTEEGVYLPAVTR